VLEALGCGGLLLDSQGRVLQTNEKGRRYLGSVMSARHGGEALASSSPERVQIALREALRASTEVLPQLETFISVPRRDLRPLLMRSIPVNGDPHARGVTTALIILDMEDCPLPDEELLRSVFLLTPAEIRLARKLSCGESLAEVARQSGISVETVRAQLKALFLKTGTRRQGELIALLAHLSRLQKE